MYVLCHIISNGKLYFYEPYLQPDIDFTDTRREEVRSEHSGKEISEEKW